MNFVQFFTATDDGSGLFYLNADQIESIELIDRYEEFSDPSEDDDVELLTYNVKITTKKGSEVFLFPQSQGHGVVYIESALKAIRNIIEGTGGKRITPYLIEEKEKEG